MIARREFVAAVTALLVAAPLARAQPRMFRMAYLAGSSAAMAQHLQQALLGRLAELGYREGLNLVVERRFADGRFERLSVLAAELVALKPDVFLTSTTPPTLAAQKATRTIPIVFVAVADPVGLKIVNSLPRPGTNATGVGSQGPEYQGKRLQWLKEVLPDATRVAVLHNPLNAGEMSILAALNDASSNLGLSLRVIEAKSEQDLPPAFKTLESERPDALCVIESAFSFLHRARIVEFANRIQLPSLYGLSEFVEAGGLMSYSISMIEQYRAAATYVSRILKGAKPADLPVEQPATFELVINLKTAKTLGLKFPQSLLLRADRVIE